MSGTELAWLAGLLEGEGTFLLHQEGDTGRVIVRIAVHMTDRDVVQRVCDLVGLGNVARRPPAKSHHKETFRWAISAKGPTVQLMELLRPHMGERRKARIDACLAAVAASGGIGERHQHHGQTLYRAGCKCEICRSAKSAANARRYGTRADVA